ncbi:alcohol dehydrogenase catalytic domain-containing protein [Sphingopyxis sp. JAI128]|uniref:alcohol dehydrogenase catalytic domain-containing protein n=1 Tax=Sphingopyxis sp. JAI128 TaxID=2723066 RepID=UPI00161ED868|nr:alcohol dehydrogenase catalytic domain-containing protein [Sphingopyxis sp. JAI128]
MDIGVGRGMAWTDVPGPKVIGAEGAGRVVAVGEGVTDFAIGDRVAWGYAPPKPCGTGRGARGRAGLTASHFATDFYPVQPGMRRGVRLGASGQPAFTAAGSAPGFRARHRRYRPDGRTLMSQAPSVGASSTRYSHRMWVRAIAQRAAA